MIAILLAGGRSERVGIDKPTLELHGEMLVERHLRQLRTAGVNDAVIVCHAGNEAAIRERTGVRTVLQRGASMSSALLTGMDATDDATRVDALCAVCVNDIVSNDDYRQFLAFDAGEGTVAIPTVPLERSFSGGYLELDSANGAVRSIVEKPQHECPAGAAANIMIHQIRGRQLLNRLTVMLRAGMEYEAAVNELIEEGTRVAAIPIRWWVAIKTVHDIVRAQAAAAQ